MNTMFLMDESRYKIMGTLCASIVACVLRHPRTLTKCDNAMYAFIVADGLGFAAKSSRSTMLLVSVRPVAEWMVVLKSGTTAKPRRVMLILFA